MAIHKSSPFDRTKANFLKENRTDSFDSGKEDCLNFLDKRPNHDVLKEMKTSKSKFRYLRNKETLIMLDVVQHLEHLLI